MSRERLRRVQRVLDARRTAADRIELELSALTRAALQAKGIVEEARRAWFEAMNTTIAAHCTSTDLADLHGYATTLGQRYEAHGRELREIDRKRESCQGKLQAARIEVRKLELWGDRVRQDEALESAGRERRTMDELAARTTRTG